MQHAPSLPSFSQSGTTSGLNSSECAILGRYRGTFEDEVRIYFDPKDKCSKNGSKFEYSISTSMDKNSDPRTRTGQSSTKKIEKSKTGLGP